MDFKGWPQEGTLEWYERAYRECIIRPGFTSAVAKDAALVLKHKARYEAAVAGTRIPWYVIGGIHFKEASCNFRACLVNGERIIGTGKRTTIVPIGRGPYATWEESAQDAIQLKRMDQHSDWSVAKMLQRVERYNGLGYITGAGRADTSPYLWARTSINDGTGLYQSDGKYNPLADSTKTSGFCAILKHLEQTNSIRLPRSA